jgi:hypothetical protein
LYINRADLLSLSSVSERREETERLKSSSVMGDAPLSSRWNFTLYKKLDIPVALEFTRSINDSLVKFLKDPTEIAESALRKAGNPEKGIKKRLSIKSSKEGRLTIDTQEENH